MLPRGPFHLDVLLLEDQKSFLQPEALTSSSGILQNIRGFELETLR